MKYLFILLTVAGLSFKCNKNQPYKDAFLNAMYKKDHIEINALQYRTDNNTALFHDNYTITAKKTIAPAQIKELLKLLSDTSNFYSGQSKNCVLVAQYGFDIVSDSGAYQFYMSKEPCAKILIYNEKLKTEQTRDLKSDNKITPFFDGLFGTK